MKSRVELFMSVECVESFARGLITRSPLPIGRDLIDLSGRTFNMEPLALVSTLERRLLQKVVKQWFDYDRDRFDFVKQLQSGERVGSGSDFSRCCDGDTLLSSHLASPLLHARVCPR